MLFDACWLKPWLVRSLKYTGYTEATPIQEKVLKLALQGKNIVGQSQTGTGKTAAFLLPMLNQIDTNKKTLQTLILAPTRELATQIGDEIRTLTKFYSVTYTCLFGGASQHLQKKSLKRRPAIVVATPGRLMDFMNQGVIDIRTVDTFILDEVDRMLDMGFVRDIKKIRDKIRNVRQTYTFSATMNDNMKAIIKEYVPHHEFIRVGEQVTVDKINHSYMAVEHEHKIHNAIKLIKTHPKEKIIIFTHTKRNTKTLQNILSWVGLNAGMLNGDMSQGKRQSTLNSFKEGKIHILVTTDVAARGLNMDNVGLVINFEVPIDAKSYIHRIWRTGRAGAEGKAIMMMSPLEERLLKDIEKEHKTKVQSSDHTAEEDSKKKYINTRLDRSTDKKGGRWGRRPSGGTQQNRRSFTPRPKDDEQKRNTRYKKSETKWPNKKTIRGPRAEGKNFNRKERPQRRK